MKRFALTAIALLALVMIMFTVGCDRKVTGNVEVVNNADTNCFKCLNGDWDHAQGEWANSVHAEGTYVDYTNRPAPNDCTRCHDQQGFIYFLANGVPSPEEFDEVSAIGCFTCHNPHENGDMRLRTDAPFTLLNGVVFDHGDGNLCANCHHSRTDASTDITDNLSVNSHWGPHHGPQADMLEGTNGYEYSGATYRSSPHKIAVPDACAGCHMGEVENHDGYKVGGHTFRIVSEDGANTQIEFCVECHEDADSINFLADEDYDHDGTIEGYQSEVMGLADSLQTLLIAQGALNASGAQYTTTVADKGVAGALYNWVFISKEDKSWGVHNFDYTIDLLNSSIDYINGLTKKASSGMAVIPSH